MKLETLYKRAKTGKIQSWQVEVMGSTITKTAGQLNTDKPLVHKEVVTTGKNIGKVNETSPEEQAVSQAKSDWNKKRDEGYKSLVDLGIGRSTSTDIKDRGYWTLNGVLVKPGKRLDTLLDEALPQFNTDASGNPKPMLATDWKKIKKINYPVLLQPKLDGVRCLMVVDVDETDEVKVTFLSRSGKPYTTLGHIVPDVKAYFTKHKDLLPVVLDGEIYA